jgi:Rieske Fe-S protein
MKIDQPRATRRRFLLALLGGWGGALLAGLAWPVVRFLAPRPEPEPDEVRLPLADYLDLAAGSARTFRWGSKPGILVRTADGGWRAFKGVCTHLDCNVSWRADLRRFHCPCHEGWFDENGLNIQGPPPKPLTEFTVAATAAELVVARPGWVPADAGATS